MRSSRTINKTLIASAFIFFCLYSIAAHAAEGDPCTKSPRTPVTGCTVGYECILNTASDSYGAGTCKASAALPASTPSATPAGATSCVLSSRTSSTGCPPDFDCKLNDPTSTYGTGTCVPKPATAATSSDSKPATVTLQVPIGGITTVSNFTQYIVVLYKFAGVFLISFAIIMGMLGGIQWIMSGGDPKKIASAKGRLISALSGIALFLLSYSILSIINPSLLNLQILEGKGIEAVVIPGAEGEEGAQSDVTVIEGLPPLQVISGDNITVKTANNRASTAVVSQLRQAATALKAKGISIIVTSAFREPAAQKKLVDEGLTSGRCTGTFTCDANYKCTLNGSCNPAICTLRNGPTGCPHTSAKAVDVWASKDGGKTQCATSATCKSPSICPKDSCQWEVIHAMQNAGFCTLSIESWHFEYPANKPASLNCKVY